jgi:integrase
MSLYKRKDSPFWWIKLPPIEGELRPVQLSAGTANKRDAQRYHDKLLADRWKQDKLGTKPRYTWDDAVQKWLEEHTHKRSLATDAAIFAWFSRHLGGKELSEITRALVDELKAKRARGVTAGTVNRHMALLRAVLRRACFDWEWLDRVPKVSMLRVTTERTRALSQTEYLRLLDQLPGHLRDMAVFSVATGLRKSNVTRLLWGQVSLERRHLFIPADQHKNGKPHSVPLNLAAMEVLMRRRGDHPTHVFAYEGHPIGQVNTKAWRAALERAGIKNFRWHDLRHTFATWHREAGTPTHELQMLGGWKSASMVERYAHVAPQGLQAAASRLDNLMAVTR